MFIDPEILKQENGYEITSGRALGITNGTD
jgi:hypothetical protein